MQVKYRQRYCTNNIKSYIKSSIKYKKHQNEIKRNLKKHNIKSNQKHGRDTLRLRQ